MKAMSLLFMDYALSPKLIRTREVLHANDVSRTLRNRQQQPRDQ